MVKLVKLMLKRLQGVTFMVWQHGEDEEHVWRCSVEEIFDEWSEPELPAADLQYHTYNMVLNEWWTDDNSVRYSNIIPYNCRVGHLKGCETWVEYMNKVGKSYKETSLAPDVMGEKTMVIVATLERSSKPWNSIDIVYWDCGRNRAWRCAELDFDGSWTKPKFPNIESHEVWKYNTVRDEWWCDGNFIRYSNNIPAVCRVGHLEGCETWVKYMNKMGFTYEETSLEDEDIVGEEFLEDLEEDNEDEIEEIIEGGEIEDAQRQRGAEDEIEEEIDTSSNPTTTRDSEYPFAVGGGNNIKRKSNKRKSNKRKSNKRKLKKRKSMKRRKTKSKATRRKNSKRKNTRRRRR